MEEAIHKLIAAIKNTDEYRDYEQAKEKAKRQPELKNQLDEFRRRKYEMQNSLQDKDLLEKMEQLEEEYGEFWSNPFVEEFLNAELAFCRMMQNMYLEITEALEFE